MIDWDKEFDENWVDDGFGDHYNELYATFYKCFFRLLDTGITQRLFYVLDYKQCTYLNGIDADFNYIEYETRDEQGYTGNYPLSEYFSFEKYSSNEYAPRGEDAYSCVSMYDTEKDYIHGTFTMYDLAFDKLDPIYKFREQAEKLGIITNERNFSDWYEFVYRNIDDDECEIPDKEVKLYEKFNKFLEKEMKHYENDVGVMREGRDANPAIVKKPNDMSLIQ